MAVFAVIQTFSNPRLEQNIEKHSHLKVRDGVWLVSAEGTATDVSNMLDISEGKAGSAIILKASSYYGRAETSIWDWIQASWE